MRKSESKYIKKNRNCIIKKLDSHGVSHIKRYKSYTSRKLHWKSKGRPKKSEKKHIKKGKRRINGKLYLKDEGYIKKMKVALVENHNRRLITI